MLRIDIHFGIPICIPFGMITGGEFNNVNEYGAGVYGTGFAIWIMYK